MRTTPSRMHSVAEVQLVLLSNHCLLTVNGGRPSGSALHSLAVCVAQHALLAYKYQGRIIRTSVAPPCAKACSAWVETLNIDMGVDPTYRQQNQAYLQL